MDAHAEEFTPTDFTRHFTTDEIALYNAKLNRLNITDPYVAPGVLFKNFSDETDTPDLSYPDIYNYLINFPSHYTGASLKAYKSLEGFQFTKCNKVSTLFIWKLPAKESYIITGRVTHSQKLSDPQLKPWVMVRRDGVVLGGHFNCTAGLDECCSHLSAVLFRAWQLGDGDHGTEEEEVAVTSKKCKWGTPSEASVKQLDYMEIKDIVFNDSQLATKKKSPNNSIPPTIQPLTDAEQSQLYLKLSQARKQDGHLVRPAVLAIVSDYAESYIPKAVSLDLPEPLTTLYNNQSRELSLEELQQQATTVFGQLMVTKEQSDVVEEETRAQSKSRIWFEQRSGRVTGSTFRAVTRTNVREPSVSLIRKICYPQSHRFSTDATRWGCKHEETTRKYYEMQHRLSHTDVLVETAGFKIPPLHPYVGASSDGYVSCSCCGSGVLEIKCPFKVKDLTLKEAASSVGEFCLEKDAQGILSLKRDHDYYYQVQMQLFVTNKSYCDFIVWTEREGNSPFVERITPDVAFFEEKVEYARDFFIKCLLPELIGKCYSAPRPVAALADRSQQWCYCHEPEVGNMLLCTSGFCSVKKSILSSHKKNS